MIHLSSPIIGEEERQAVDRVLASGALAQGPEVAAFEGEFAEVVALCGATPVFADIEPDHFCLDPDAASAAITPRTAAIMPVHLYGHPADMTAFTQLAERHSLALVEDAAQAHLATLEGTPAGLGDVAMFSFYPTKNMTTGEGGMVVTADEQMARTVRLLRNQGMEQRYANELVGFNARMTDLAAAIGRVQLTRLHGWTNRRRANAATLDAHLAGVTTAKVAGTVEHAYHQYTIRSDDRDLLALHLKECGVASGVYYPVPVHRLQSFALDLDLPETERAAREVLSLPVRPDLTDEELAKVVEAVNAFRA